MHKSVQEGDAWKLTNLRINALIVKNFTFLHLRCTNIYYFYIYTKRKTSSFILGIYMCCTYIIKKCWAI